VTTINIFDPVYDDGTPSRDELDFVSADVDNKTDSVGIYLQDQIDLSEQFKVLLGGRLDFVDQEEENLQNNETATQYDEAFSPRIGLVYQPSDSLSLYGSFSESFIPNDMTGPEGEFLEPERGTQYEAGLRAEFLDGDLSLNLAAFNITKQNIAVSVPGPGNANVNRAIGEEESRGIELDLAGEIADGWKIIATYAHTDTEVTEDEMDIEGNQRPGVPKDQASLWTTYEIQQGNLQGLEFGAGVFFVGDRKGNRENNIELPSYARVDARLAYSRNNWEAAVNFKNLFDADIVQSQTSFGKIGLQPGIPFTVIGSFSVEF
jgi:iron complex outermembrane receptor protein